ncbi:hypothetical protein [Claveliimonas bilis]|uniref:Uncharacterized protein n=1 Tax=Claveliimonas bilis TaxID=3028070 RepID=A0ABM8I788_9FIRM|nr:hypothetical protein [Claveliimonas bilis]BDZ77055.1 hypothetical protein Lac1_12380 [Claveliimonas bilis]
MKKKMMIFLASIFFVALAMIYAVIDRTTDIYDSNIDSSDYNAVGLTKSGVVEQEFESAEEYLDGMAVKLDASGNTNKIVLDYALLDKDTRKEITQGEISLEDVQSGKFFHLKFDRINGCMGESYIFKIQVKECDESSVVSVYYANDVLVARTLRHGFDLETFIITICFVLYIVLFMKWLSKLFNQGN